MIRLTVSRKGSRASVKLKPGFSQHFAGCFLLSSTLLPSQILSTETVKHCVSTLGKALEPFPLEETRDDPPEGHQPLALLPLKLPPQTLALFFCCLSSSLLCDLLPAHVQPLPHHGNKSVTKTNL